MSLGPGLDRACYYFGILALCKCLKKEIHENKQASLVLINNQHDEKRVYEEEFNNREALVKIKDLISSISDDLDSIIQLSSSQDNMMKLMRKQLNELSHDSSDDSSE